MRKQLNKITLDVRKQLKRIEDELPPIPLLDKNGRVSNKVTAELVHGADVKEKKVDGKDVQSNQNYIKRGKQMVMANHGVALRTAFQQEGSKGVEQYIAYVNHVYGLITKGNESIKEKSDAKG